MLLLALPFALSAPTAEAGTTKEEINRTIKRKDGGAEKSSSSQGRQRANKRRGKKKDKGPKYVGPFEKDEYPLQERLRPLTLPAGMAEGELAFGYADPNYPSADGGVDTQIRAALGIADRAEVRVGTGIAWSPDVAWQDNVTLEVHALASDGKRFDFAPGVVVPLTFVDDGPLVDVNVDLFGRYLTGRSFLYFGRNAISINVNPDFGIGINGNVGAGTQFTKSTVGMIDLNLFSATLAPDAAGSGIWERLTSTVTLQHSPSNTADIGIRGTVGLPYESTDATAWSARIFGALRI